MPFVGLGAPVPTPLVFDIAFAGRDVSLNVDLHGDGKGFPCTTNDSPKIKMSGCA